MLLSSIKDCDNDEKKTAQTQNNGRFITEVRIFQKQNTCIQKQPDTKYLWCFSDTGSLGRWMIDLLEINWQNTEVIVI